jgi:pimeloyl-ACP methyl ester carboxylesterase
MFLLQALCAMLDQLNAPGKVVVVGHDWGAAVAWALAFTVPDRVQKLAVLSVGSPGERWSVTLLSYIFCSLVAGHTMRFSLLAMTM